MTLLEIVNDLRANHRHWSHSGVGCRDCGTSDHPCSSQQAADELEQMRRRFLWLARELGIDQIGEIDLHELASNKAPDGEPGDDEYVAAWLEAIDKQLEEENNE